MEEHGLVVLVALADNNIFQVGELLPRAFWREERLGRAPFIPVKLALVHPINLLDLALLGRLLLRRHQG